MDSHYGSTNGEVKDTLVTGQTSRGAEVHGTLIRLTRLSIVFELYGPYILQLSEVLSEFRIVVNSQTIYSGHATVRNLMNTGQVLICEATLEEHSWRDVRFDPIPMTNGTAQSVFNNFFQEWQKLYRVLPEYKTLIADIHAFLTDLRLWLEQFELNIR